MSTVRAFPGEPLSVPAARQFVREALAGGPTDSVDHAELMVSELTSNCVRHTGSPFEVTIALRDGQLLVEVTDGGLGMPELRQPDTTDFSGRGLLIVRTLADEWGTRRAVPSGKTVWFTLPWPGAGGGGGGGGAYSTTRSTAAQPPEKRRARSTSPVASWRASAT